ncbi:MAG: LysM peptidoglycan-binding domain-containing protein [Planctomycetia bacterium]|nr:LysM peptidoglycan-binding domain-containing protein [Planctomycetia bacterium]
MIKLFEKLFKTVFVLAVWLFIAVATAAVLPDAAWEKFPTKLSFVREFLAEKNIISSQFRKDSNGWAESGDFVNPVDKLAATPAPTELSGGNPDPVVNTEPNLEEGLAPIDVVPNIATTEVPAFPTAAPFATETIAETGTVPDSGQGNRALTGQEEPPALPAFSHLTEASGSDSVDPQPAGLLPVASVPESVSDSVPLPTLPAADPLLVRANEGQAQADSPAASSESSPFPALAAAASDSSRDTLPNLSFDQPGEMAAPTPAPAPAPTSVAGPALASEETGNPDQSGTQPLAITAFPAPEPDVQPAGFTSTAAPTSVLPEFPASIDVPAAPTASAPHEQLLATLEQSQDPSQVKETFYKLNQILAQSREQLSSGDLQLLHENLDRLAFTVFYDGRRHILEPEYIVGQSETLSSIAASYKITPQLLGVLNSLDCPVDQPLPHGTHLKVVRGPVTATVSMNEKELTLLFDGLYAGRFKMGCSAGAKSLRGVVSVTRKVQNPQYNGPLENGQWGSIQGGDATNPLGAFWIELNNGLGLQGTNHPEYIGSDVAAAGGLIFSNKDINHLNILLPTGASIHLCD